MKSGLFALIAASTIIFPAISLGADGPQSPVLSWTGFYVGAHAGVTYGGVTGPSRSYSGANAVVVQGPGFNAPAVQALSDSNGYQWGVQAGFNYQFLPSFVVGIEGDVSSANRSRDASKTSTGASFWGHYTSEDMSFFGTVRGRVGYLLSPQLLIFATGGLAIAKVETLDNVGFEAGGVTRTQARSNSLKTGSVFGAGVEYAINKNWSVKGEYLSYNLGSSTTSNPGFGPGFPVSYVTRFKHTGQIARAGLNYKF